MKTQFSMTGFVELRQKFESLMLTDPSTSEKFDRIVREALTIVKKSIQTAARNKMKSDPREAEKAVAYTVYRRIIGGNVNILGLPKGKAGTKYVPTKTRRGTERGGNRKLRSERTMLLESYTGYQRGFVLRFLNSGTKARYNGGRNHSGDAYDKFIQEHDGRGFRGSISPRNFFAPTGNVAMSHAMKFIENEIDKLIAKEFGNG